MQTLGARKNNQKSDVYIEKTGPSLFRTIIWYAIAFIIPLLAISLYFYEGKRHVRSSLTQDLREKAKYYSIHAKEFDLVFLGDSRTYCGIHADIIDRHLGTHSVNMAHFAHWFATQYPYFQEVIKHIPKGTTVVWTIGHINFVPSNKIQNRYPIGIANIPRFLLWGFKWDDIADNIYYFNPFLQILAESKTLHTALFNELNKTIWQSTSAVPVEKKSSPEAEKTAETFNLEKKKLEDKYYVYPSVAGVYVPAENNKINSVVLYKKGGSYFRIELDKAFFREKQQEHGKLVAESYKNFKETGFKDSPEYWQLFVSMLDLFKKHNINLIVNETEEAPFVYRAIGEQNSFRTFMCTKVKPYVQSLGFKYVRTNLDSLTDDDYFDYDHLNSEGSEKYDAMLAEQIKPYLKRAK